MPSATFVLSTGRCGTQWLAEKLNEVYGDLLSVEHEPLDNDYEPRRALGGQTSFDRGPGNTGPLEDHLAAIEQRLDGRDYVECGHPCWSSLPFIARRLAGRIRIVHLVRHPIPTALSWLTHSAYEAPLLPHLREKVLLSPFDPGVTFPEYQERWPAMSAFEKCLYYWAEVNAFALRLESEAGIPWHRVAFEELFESAAMAGILRFLALPHREAMLDARADHVDRHRYKAASGFPDLRVMEEHPRFREVAARLGYDPGWADVEGLKRRYVWPGL